MRRSGPLLLIITVLFLMASASSVMADDLQWQLIIDYEGTIKETISSEVDLDPGLFDEQWHADSAQQYTRNINNWEEYFSLDDRLPLELTGRDLKFIGFWRLAGTPLAVENELAQALSNRSLELTICLPGFIRESSGAVTALDYDHQLQWHYADLRAVSEEALMVRYWLVDGFLSAILLILIVSFGLFIYMIMRVRKVSRFIRTEYSIENIDLEELALEVEAELNELEKQKKEGYTLQDIDLTTLEVGRETQNLEE